MTACMQPGCTGTILDGYCDICGSPAGAVPFVLAESPASAGLPEPADEPGLAVRQGSEFPRQPESGGLTTACTQPECTGTIVDGYCDVCGSPADAVPFVPAAAEVESPAAGDKPGLTAVPASIPPPIPVDEERPTQRIPRVKMPRSIPPPVPVDEERPTQRIPRVKMPTQQLSTQDLADPGAADPGVGDAQKVDGEKVDPADGDSEKVNGKVELAEDEADGAQDYRTRVEEAQLPDAVREAALCEVGKLERTTDQSPESCDIRTWLDTVLDLPWSTKTPDWIDIQGSREVEASLRKLIEPVVGDIEGDDAAKVEAVVGDFERDDATKVEAVAADTELDTVLDLPSSTKTPDWIDIEGSREVEASLRKLIEPAAVDIEGHDAAKAEAVVGDFEGDDAAGIEAVVADAEKVDRAPAGPYDDDTVVTPAVLAGFSGRVQPRPQLPEQQIVGPVLVETSTEKRRRFRSLALAAALAALLIGALFFVASRGGSVTAQSDPSVTATATVTVSQPTRVPSNESTNSGAEDETIQLEDLPDSARPFEAVRIQGTYRGGTGTFLRVQRWDGGKWLDFPLPTKTDQSGQFITQAEFGQPGRYWLRVLDPDSGVTSKPFVVVIKG
jgi:hypothetical protein